MERLGQGEEYYLATGFRDVDATGGEKMAQCLRLLDSLPSFRKYKARILEALDPQLGDFIADLGCGLGLDVLRIAERVGSVGRAIGIDASLDLLASARGGSRGVRNAQFLQADIRALPLQNDALSTCKVDRTLQHVSDPVAVLKEAYRTLRPGGLLVCSEPDWGTLTIDDNERRVVQQITEFWAASFCNPWIGRQLLNHLRETGFVDARVEGALLVAPSFETSDRVFDLVQTANRLAKATGDESVLEWIARVRERDRSYPVWSSVTLFINFARKPM
jgi:ubiquinone/menaquinone biosynthesis C-methylase UbiE